MLLIIPPRFTIWVVFVIKFSRWCRRRSIVTPSWSNKFVSIENGTRSRGDISSNSRVFELADSSKLFTLNASRIVWIALDLLFSASNAGNGEPFARFASFGYSPVSIHGFTIDNSLAMASIVVKIAHALTRDFCFTDEAWQEVRSGPNLWAEAIFRGQTLRNCRAVRRWRCAGSRLYRFVTRIAPVQVFRSGQLCSWPAFWRLE